MTADSDRNAIELERLTICYGDFTAVDQLTLTVARGETFGLLGPNGAGKTTTFSCLTRQAPISGGAVRVLGLDLVQSFDRIKPRFGYVPDSDNHFDEFTAEQNLALFCALYQVPRARIDECLAIVELEREKRLPVRTFSKGMRKKLLMARALLHRPEILYLDEPTANLDVHSTQLIREVIQRLAKEGVTVFMTTHNMHEVELVCDRVAIINRGKLIALDAPLAFKARNADRIVDVTLERGGSVDRISVNLTADEERRRLARVLESEIPVTLHTREFNFYEVFLRLTGEDYN
jgi:ABC-2 type transport system ATP-binding protein